MDKKLKLLLINKSNTKESIETFVPELVSKACNGSVKIDSTEFNSIKNSIVKNRSFSISCGNLKIRPETVKN